MNQQRTDWVEKEAARLFGFPLTAETVLLRPSYRDGCHDREVCDVLLALRRESIVLSLKSQEDPLARRGPKLERWSAKEAQNAATQITGALKTIKAKPFWCQHHRRGRVDIEPGWLSAKHGIVVLETTGEVALPADLSEGTSDVPFTYLSTNDLLNLVMELRSFPDLVAYLDARLALPMSIRRRIGNERLLYEYYLLNEENFRDCDTLADAQRLIKHRAMELHKRLEAKHSLDRYAWIIEHVSDALATRRPDYALGLDAATVALFDSEPRRINYLRLQEGLCDLRLAMRRALGEALEDVNQQLTASSRSQDTCYRAVMLDGKPDFVYVLLATRGIERPTVTKRALITLRAALAHYGKRRGMVIADRDGAGYEVGLAEIPQPTAAEIEAGRQLFGALRMKTLAIRTLP